MNRTKLNNLRNKATNRHCHSNHVTKRDSTCATAALITCNCLFSIIAQVGVSQNLLPKCHYLFSSQPVSDQFYPSRSEQLRTDTCLF